MQLTILTPQAEVLKADVRSVTVPGAVGEFQVLPGHTELLSLIQPGELLCEPESGAPLRFTVGEGHAEVTRTTVTIAVDSAVKV